MITERRCMLCGQDLELDNDKPCPHCWPGMTEAEVDAEIERIREEK